MTIALDTFHRTHEIFNGLLGKNIELTLAGGGGSFTDVETGIVVDMAQAPTRKVRGALYECGHPTPGLTPLAANFGRGSMRLTGAQEAACLECGNRWAYRSLEHEWQHHVFGSEPKVASTAAFKLATKYFPKIDQELAAEAICKIANALDDIRVNGLWEEIYPGSADDLWEKWKEITIKNEIAAQGDAELAARERTVAMQILRVGVGRPPHQDFFDLFTLVPLVRKKSFREVMRLTHYIVRKYRDEIEKQLEQQQSPPPQASGKKLSAGKGRTKASTPSGAKNQVDTVVEGPMPFGNYPGHIATLALGKLEVEGLDPQKLENLLDDLLKQANTPDEDMQDALDTLKQAVLPQLQSAKRQLERETGEDINMYFDAAGVPIKPLSALELSRAAFLKRSILSIQSRSKYRLDAEGAEIESDAYLQGRHDPENIEYFRAESSSFGFLFSLVLDQSGSMEGAAHEGVQAAVALLREVLGPQPYVKGRYFWFWGDGQTHVVETDGTTYPNGGFGSTPLRIATKLVLETFDQEESPSVEKLVVILTDGDPSDCADPKTIRADIDEARHKGVKVFTVLVGMPLTPEREEMFGPSTYIRTCEPTTDSIGRTIEDLVLTGFLRYLRHRSR